MSKKPDNIEPVSNEIIVGVDDGFAMTKLVVMMGGKVVKRLTIPSRARSGVHGTTAIAGSSDGEIDSRYQTEGGTFTVANLTDSESARFDEYPFSGMNRAIITHALRVAGLGGKQVRIATGLPLSMFYKGSSNNTDVINRKIQSLLISVSPLDNSEVALITNHQVYPEGLSAWIDYAIDEMGQIRADLDESIGIIDIGGRTTDIAVVLPGRRIDHARSGSADLGVLNVIEEVILEIKKEHNVAVGPEKVEAALRTRTIKLWGKPVDIGPSIDKAVTSVMGAILREVNRRLSSGVDLDKVLLVGGGAYLFSGVEKQFPNVEIPTDPEYANARGFAKYLGLA